MTAPSIVTTREPARPSRVVGSYPLATAQEMEAALSRAVGSQADWAGDASRRSEALGRWADAIAADAGQLALLVAREVGKPLGEARAEVARGVAILRYYAQAAFDPTGELLPPPNRAQALIVERVPLGIVLAICPWNFPIAIPLWKLAPALAYGNAVILKPSTLALGVAHRLMALGRPAFPEGVVELVGVAGPKASKLLDDERISGVSFTGSDVVGRAIAGRLAARGIPVQAEMGGQNASIVLDDAVIGPAARTIAGAAFAFAGQKCTATSRVVVVHAIASAFLEALVTATEELKVGEPELADTIVGPVITEAARDAVREAVRAAISRGGRLLAGGEQLDREGWFWKPTLVQVGDPQDPLAQEEVFGPVAAVIRVDDETSAIEAANSTRYGLAAAVFGADVDRAVHVARRVRAGMLRVNSSTTGVDYYAPFGGAKASSYGPREQGRAAREFYTTSRTLTVAN